MHDAKLARGKLEKLLDHGRRTVWNPAHDVNWDFDRAKKLENLSGEKREALRSLLSLVYYSDSQGKDILEGLCRNLDKKRCRTVAEFPLGEKVREFFEQQMGDEQRHASGIRLLFDRLELEPEPPAVSHAFYSKILLAEGFFDAKLVLIYWYIEILAKGIFTELKKRFPETCLDLLFTKIIRDEARHVGFGEVYLPIHAEQAGKRDFGKMALAYYSSAIVLPGLYRFTNYSRAAKVLDLNISHMFATGMAEVSAKAKRLPQAKGLLDFKKPAGWLSAFL